MIASQSKPFLLVILDGWGFSRNTKGNAVKLAKTPFFDRLWFEYPHTVLKASGLSAGLPRGQIGNSEAGHMNIGAGRVIMQDSTVVNNSIADGTFFKNPAFIQAIRCVRANKSRLHLMGLLTGIQSAHADRRHLFALLDLVKKQGLTQVYLHLFTDGRDSRPTSALDHLKDLTRKIKELGLGKIVSITGRYYAMDRIKKWERTQVTYDNFTLGNGERTNNPAQAIKNYYAQGITDEFIPPSLVVDGGPKLLQDNDGIIFFNLRTDRARQIAQALTQPKFKGFQRKKVLKNLCFATMTEFGVGLEEVLTAYPSRVYSNTLPSVLDQSAGYRQLYIAESEKFAHVSYFLNGGSAKPVDRENRVCIPSPTVKSYVEKPKMHAARLTRRIVKYLEDDTYNFIVVNYANPDMVGHTGNLKAAIIALEFLDDQLEILVKEVRKKRGTTMVTSDHGNVEEMIDLQSGAVLTAHTANLVPFILVPPSKKHTVKLKKRGRLANIAPTIFDYLGLTKPRVVREESLII